MQSRNQFPQQNYSFQTHLPKHNSSWKQSLNFKNRRAESVPPPPTVQLCKQYLLPNKPSQTSFAINSQRLAEPLLQLRAVGAADTRSRAVAQDNVELAMRDRLQLHDALDVHDGRAVHAHETARIEAVGKVVERGAVEEFLARNVKVHIHARGFDPVDIDHANEARGAAGLHHQPVPAPVRIGRHRGNHLHNPLAELEQIALIEAGLGPRQSAFKALVAERLQQVVERVGLEGA